MAEIAIHKYLDYLPSKVFYYYETNKTKYVRVTFENIHEVCSKHNFNNKKDFKLDDVVYGILNGTSILG